MAKRCRSCCAPPTCALICAEVKSNCSPNPGIDGATVTVTSKGIASIAVTNGGSNYSQTPVVVISPTNGSGGTAIALLTATTVNTSSGTATAAGSGYTSIPTVTLTLPVGQTGSGAAASVTMAVAGGTVSAAGSGYAVNDLLTIGGGTVTAAAVLRVGAVDGSGGVTAVSVNTIGNYSALPASPASVTGGTGSGATFNLTWKLNTLTVTAAGSGYSAPPIVVFSGGGGSGAAGTVGLTLTTLASVTVTAAGTYHTAPGITFSGGGGGATGAAATATLTGATTVGTCSTTGQVNSITMTNAGTGFTGIPSVTIGAPASGTTATGTATMGTTTIASVSLTNGGSNYTTAPTATVGGSIHGTGTVLQAKLAAGPVASLTLGSSGTGYTNGTGYAISFVNTNTGGTGAAGTFDVVSGAVTNLVLTSGGSAYFTAPTISFPGAGGSGATGTAGLTPQAVATLTITAAGSGYQLGDTPTVVFGGGGGGSGAAATATLGTFTVTGITMGNKGSGYVSVPTVSFSGGGGTGAAGTAVVRHQCCQVMPVAGGYGFSASKTGWVTNSGTVVLGSCVDTTTSIQLNPATATLTVTANGCNGLPYSGVTVTVKQAGTTVDSGTTDGSGIYTWANAASGVTYTYELSGIAATFAAPSPGTITINTCSTNAGTFNLGPATGCGCLFADCVIPAPASLTLSDSTYGTTTITLGSVVDPQTGLSTVAWNGSKTINYPACSGNAAVSGVTILYLLLTAGVLKIYHSGDASSAGFPVVGTPNTGNSTTATGHTCPPSLVATWNVAGASGHTWIYCAAGTVTVSQ